MIRIMLYCLAAIFRDQGRAGTLHSAARYPRLMRTVVITAALLVMGGGFVAAIPV
jgi:hypothetical protein